MSGPVVVLVGPPGAGKSTVGERVAQALGVAFRDTDADVEQATGHTVADIFIHEGEAAFRELERSAVAAAIAEHEGVLALGGGAVLDRDTRAALRGHTVVFLDVALADAVQRVGLARDRPVLLGNPRAQLHKMLEARRPVYEAVASATVVTDDRDVDDIVRDVLAVLGA